MRTTTAPTRPSTARGLRLTTALAACALALTPWAAQAQATLPSTAPWKLAY